LRASCSEFCPGQINLRKFTGSYKIGLQVETYFWMGMAELEPVTTGSDPEELIFFNIASTASI